MRQTSSGEYVDRYVEESLNGVSAHLVNLGFKKGKLDPEDVDASYDVTLYEGLESFETVEGADPYPVTEIMEGSFISEARLDTDRGYFEFDIRGGGTSEAWMPYLDEGKAKGIFLIENPWTEEAHLTAYDGNNVSGSDLSGIEPIQETAYRMGREFVTDKGLRNQDITKQNLKSNARNFYSTIQTLEEDFENEEEVGSKQHNGQVRGNDIVANFSSFMNRARKANLVDYTVSSEFGSSTFERSAGGYKNLTEFPESAPYSTLEEAIDFRYPESWNQHE